MMRSPIRPIVMPSASAGATASATWKKRSPYRRMFTAFAIVAPAIPPSSEMPPFQMSSHSSGLANSPEWAST